jgi:hypothetical protein
MRYGFVRCDQRKQVEFGHTQSPVSIQIAHVKYGTQRVT